MLLRGGFPFGACFCGPCLHGLPGDFAGVLRKANPWCPSLTEVLGPFVGEFLFVAGVVGMVFRRFPVFAHFPPGQADSAGLFHGDGMAEPGFEEAEVLRSARDGVTVDGHGCEITEFLEDEFLGVGLFRVGGLLPGVLCDGVLDLLLDGADDPDQVYVNEVLPGKMEYNLEYIKRFNFFYDIKLMFMTFFAVLK